jgi:hypothetical protein
MKLADGERKGLAECSRAFRDSEAGMTTNFRPVGEAACDDAGFGFFVALKLISLSSSFGKLGLS